MNVVFLGAPGSGKGTQSKLIEDYFHIIHISTGDIFRKAIKEETKAGKAAKSYIDAGKLVPDEVTLNIVDERLECKDCMNGFIFDGFPRTLNQAIEYDKKHGNDSFKIDKVIYLEVDELKLLDRIVNRRVCPKCGASYHLITSPSEVEGICDKCSSELVARSDDNATSLKARLNDFNELTFPLIKYYSDSSRLVKINAMNDIDKVFKDIIEAVK